MNNKISTMTLIVISVANLCLAQPKVFTDGNEAQGVRLSISLSNNLVAAGSKITLYTSIQNTSTNVVFVNPTTSKTFYLTNSSGKVFYLIPTDDRNPIEPFISNTKPSPQPIEPNETKKEVVVLRIGKDTDVGSYDLIELRSITITDGKMCSLTSNSLNVKVVD